MNKMIKSMLCLLSLTALISCGNPEPENNGSNNDSTQDTTTPEHNDNGGSTTPEGGDTTPDSNIGEKGTFTETLTFFSEKKSPADPNLITGFIAGDVANKLVTKFNSESTHGALLKSLTGDPERTEIKDCVAGDNKTYYYLKLGGKAASNISFTVMDDIKVSKIVVNARGYFNYVAYNNQWHNASNPGITIKSGTKEKEFSLPTNATALPDLKACEYTFTSPVSSFDIWCNETKDGRALIESVEITYTRS